MAEKWRFLRSIAVLALLAAFAAGLSAQETAGGVVVYAEGREFSVVRAGSAVRFSLSDDAYLGYALRAGDLLQTGPSTFVEVQLKPKGSMLKIAENSSFVFQGIGGNAESTTLQLLYGRVRAKVAKASGNESFTIRSKNTTAGVRGTDFGFDSILAPGAGMNAPTVRVYAFSGELSVSPYAPESSASAPPALAVKAGELLVVDASASLPVVERRMVDEEVKAYWRVNDFKGKPPIVPPPSASLSAAPPPSAPSAAGPTPPASSDPAPSPRANATETEAKFSIIDVRPYKSALVAKNTAIGVSIAFNAVGFAVQAVGAYFVASGANAQAGSYMVLGGGALVGASVVTLVSSLLIKTP